jgi:hypothetical protein
VTLAFSLGIYPKAWWKLPILRTIKNPIFLRPRRFGKSLLCQMLKCYYDVNQKDDFDRLFGQTYIGQHPTPSHNSFFVLHLNFSIVKPIGSLSEIEKRFDLTCNLRMKAIVTQNFNDKLSLELKEDCSSNLQLLLNVLEENKELPRLYVIIDEYDNFANKLITAHKDSLYHELTGDGSFLKTLKDGRETGTITNVFVTGVLPLAIDDMASGYNIGNFITLQTKFGQMLGFTQKETEQLLDEVYRDYEIEPATRQEVEAVLKNRYDGYRFVQCH